MGCGGSKDDVVPPTTTMARTATTGAWDDDFIPKPRTQVSQAAPTQAIRAPSKPQLSATTEGMESALRNAMKSKAQHSIPAPVVATSRQQGYSSGMMSNQFQPPPSFKNAPQHYQPPRNNQQAYQQPPMPQSMAHQQHPTSRLPPRDPAYGHRPGQSDSRVPAPNVPTRPPPSQTAGYASGAKFDDFFEKGRDLGKGAFAKVFIAIEKSTRRQYAAKQIYDRTKMKWNGRDALNDEISNLSKLRQAPHVVHLHANFMDPRQCYLVLELLPGGELFERVISKGTFTEEEARDSCRGVLSALAYMHDRRMTHRDLKPENLLLANAHDMLQVKVSDFGFSRTLKGKNECRTVCGTPGYLAPEILERWPAYDVKCDIWSFGVILFLLLGGYLPFDAHASNDTKMIFERTRNGQYSFYPQRWKDITHSAKDLVAKCLTVNPNKRLSAHDALSHAWMGEGVALPNKIISVQSLASTVKEAKVLKERKKATAKTHEDRIQELNDDFTVFLEGRAEDSIVSNMTGAGKTFAGRTVATAAPRFTEDSVKGKLFNQVYRKGEQLGEGGSATLFRCTHKRYGTTYAVKEVDSLCLTPAEKSTLHDEIVVLQYLRGTPHIIQLYDVFKEPGKTYLIMEEMKGGDLMNRICAKEVYTEREARELCSALFHAVNYCHRKKIAHRDIKLDNLLLQEPGDDATLKLSDFGFAKKVRVEKCLTTMCGTPNYMAPEILNPSSSGYDYRCDMWSVGVVMYCLLGGYLPFEGSLQDLSGLIVRGEYHFHDKYWQDISPSAKQLITSLLRTDPDRRLSAQEALEMPWMGLDEEELSVVDLSANQDKMRTLTTGKLKVKNAVRAIIGANKLKLAAGLTSQLRVPDSSISEEEEEPDFEVMFEDVYTVGRQIGETTFAKVHVATNRLTKKQYSVKKVVRRLLHHTDVAALHDEIEVLQAVCEGGKKHVVCIHEVFEDPDATYLVLDPVSGEPLADRLIQKRKYTEFDAKELVRNLLLGVNHCHRLRVAIRNLTLDNLLLPTGSESDILITDFEFAKKVVFRNSLRTQCGTQEFVAPEVLENRPQYDVSCDMWTVGVIVFILLGGYYPFRGNSEEEVLRNVRYGNFEFRARFFQGVSEDAKSVMRRMMTVDAEERITADEALTSVWINADHTALSTDLSSTVAEMKKEVKPNISGVVVASVNLQRQN